MQAVKIEIPPNLEDPFISGISSDSRNINKGDLFVGIPGENVDGGCYCSQAFSGGAVAAIVGPSTTNQIPQDKKNFVLVVPDPVTKYLGELSAEFWGNPSLKMRLIGVTGTNGKTTTTHLIEFLSKAVGEETALFGTLVNRWPMHSETSTHTTLFGDSLHSKLASASSKGASLGAMEVSSHALSQYRVAGIKFSGAVFTNLTQDHLDYHDTMETYFEAKSRLFKSPLMVLSETRVVVNIDDEWGARLAKSLGDCCWRSSIDSKVIESEKPELFMRDLKMTSDGVEGVLFTPLGSGSFRSALIGGFNLMNLLQAIGVLVQQGLNIDELLVASEKFPGVPGRMEKVEILNPSNNLDFPTVLIDYAHTPDGLRNALLALKPFTLGRLICLFGCGGDRDKSKRPKMGSIAAQVADVLIVTSDNPRTEHPQRIIDNILEGIPREREVFVELDRAIAIDRAISIAQKDDVVLIAGKGHEDYQILGDQKIYFNDREISENIFRKNLESRRLDSIN
ncbi:MULTISPECIES: UDP-N-acetylmuramoyl-L-alanyl-D-glutamate--2,6-diaminopimelate ligase [Prochlorococcus]|uniref:UDP-N-acetylmuramoyl-L-alanyl-D-glutamate--2, 6-diaminopimelate ligase n=1 Tax=Prochlorococcus sp. MIT 0601 TaxID=1499498 RepID=UPI000533A50A|nr:UDP-N-acetylmuramoylalanyl-D-glutamate--2,6- diaminopimelate ligase [Prochlorococcus sp. MIT 0601]